jgi:hypothetical protein
MQSGRKVVMLATNAFGLGIDKPDIRYIIHYQMPGSPESYVQEAGRAGRDGKPARCVLLFQPEDIEIQEHFLKEAHPTKSQARMVAEGLYAWSDEGKEVSVRDLALSMALPERRVRVILSVLEAMGVAEEVKAARWKGVEPKPTREADRQGRVGVRGAAHLGSPSAGLVAGVHEHAALPGADAARLLRGARGRQVRSVRFLRGPRQRGVRSGIGRRAPRAARRHRLSTRAPRRRRRRGGEPQPQIAVGSGVHARPQPHGRPVAPAPAPAVVFETPIPTDVLPPLAPPVVGLADPSERDFDPSIWNQLDGHAGTPMAGEPVMDLAEIAALWPTSAEAALASPAAPAPAGATAVEPSVDPDRATWDAVRDANIRAYADWRAADPVSLPVRRWGWRRRGRRARPRAFTGARSRSTTTWLLQPRRRLAPRLARATVPRM